MSDVHEKFLTVLSAIDAEDKKPVNQNSIQSEFKGLVPKDEGYNLSVEENAEYLAFTIREKYGNDHVGYGTYFGPAMTMVDNQGNQYEAPAFDLITPEIILYWKSRIKDVKHPYLVSRYIGLVWEFAPVVLNEPVDHTLRKEYLTAQLQILENRSFENPTLAAHQLKRIAHIVGAFNDQAFIPQVKKLILDLESEYAEQEKPMPVGFSFDMLFNNKNYAATSEEIEGLVDRLENQLIQFSTPNTEGKTDPWGTEVVAGRLAAYYNKAGKLEDVKRVILKVGEAYEPLFGNVQNFQVAGWLQKIFELYKYYQLNTEAEEVLKRLRTVSKEAAKEMAGFEHKFNIPHEIVEEMNSFIYGGDAETAFFKIVNSFIPNKAQAKEQLIEFAKEFPMQYSFPIEIQDSNGRKVAKVDRLESDIEGHIILKITEQLDFTAFFLHLAIEEGIKNGTINIDSVMSFLSKSSAIGASRLPIIEKALQYYFSGDYLMFCHLAIPQFEEAMRNIVERSGGNILKVKDGIYNLRLFDDILHDKIIRDVFGEDLQTYIRVIFSDPKGWNVRNQICHGLLEIEFFNKQVGDRILHTFLTLGMVRSTV